MEKEIRVIDETKGILRITTLNERWYSNSEIDPKTGLPFYKFYPSVTWKSGYYPKGIGYFKWLASKGWDESQTIMIEAGHRGTTVHKATEILEKGGVVPLTATFEIEGVKKELQPEEIEAIFSFKRFFELVRPEVLASEITVFGDNEAGTVDCIWRVKDKVKVDSKNIILPGIYIIDKKTSQQVWESHRIQLNMYSEANIDYKLLGISEQEWKDRKLAVLGLGNKLTKAGYKWTPVEHNPKMSQVARDIWVNENPEAKPKQMDYPLVIEIEKEGGENAQH